MLGAGHVGHRDETPHGELHRAVTGRSDGVIRFFRRSWFHLLIVVVVLAAGLAVHRVRGFFGAEPIMAVPGTAAEKSESYSPRVVKYAVYGSPLAVAEINYLDLDTQPKRVDGAALPWEITLRTTAPSAFPYIVAQGNGSTIGCRIEVDGEVRDEKTSNGVNAQTFCLVKSA
jgi:hypothetical protein